MKTTQVTFENGQPVSQIKTLKVDYGGMPSAKEARAQVNEQRALDTTTVFGIPVKQEPTQDKSKTFDKPKPPPPTKDLSEVNVGDKNEVDEKSKPSSTSKRDENISKLAKLERARLDTERQLKAVAAERDLSSKELAELKSFFEEAKVSPLKLLERTGLSLEDVALAVINDGKETPETAEKRARQELKAEIDAIKQSREQEQLAAKTQVEQGAMNQFLADVNKSIIENGGAEAYELTVTRASMPAESDSFRNKASEDAWQIANAFYETNRTIPSPDLIAKKLEEFYEMEDNEMLDLLMKSKKNSSKVSGKKSSESKKKESSSISLGGDKTRPLPGVGANGKESDKDKERRLIAWGNAQLAKK